MRRSPAGEHGHMVVIEGGERLMLLDTVAIVNSEARGRQ
mgnify:CR=1 FL=1